MNLTASSTRLRILLAGAVLCLLAASGCSSSSAGSSHLLYVATGNGVFAYRIDNHSGNATAVFAAPFVVGNSPSAIAVTPSNRFAYVTNQQDDTISLLRIDTSSGALTEVLPRTSTDLSPAAMVMDSTGSFLFVANQGSNDVQVFSIASDGSLKPASGAPAHLASSPSALALSSSGNLLFVAVPNVSAIYAFTVSSGTLTPVATPFPVSNGLASLTIDSSTSFLYAPDPAANTITGFAINSGALTPLPGSPYGTTLATNILNTPVSLVVDPTGKYLYAANFAASSVSGFSIASNGDLTPLVSAAGTAGSNSNLITFDSNGKFVYVGNSGSNSITIFSPGTSGTLTSSNTIQVGTVARGLAFTK